MSDLRGFQNDWRDALHTRDVHRLVHTIAHTSPRFVATFAEAGCCMQQLHQTWHLLAGVGAVGHVFRHNCAEKQRSCVRIDTLVNFAQYDNKTVGYKGVGMNPAILLLILLFDLSKAQKRVMIYQVKATIITNKGAVIDNWWDVGNRSTGEFDFIVRIPGGDAYHTLHLSFPFTLEETSPCPERGSEYLILNRTFQESEGVIVSSYHTIPPAISPENDTDTNPDKKC